MIKIGILGYGNLGRGVENSIKQNHDMELVAIFTRRNPESLKINSNAKVVSILTFKASSFPSVIQVFPPLIILSKLV